MKTKTVLHKHHVSLSSKIFHTLLRFVVSQFLLMCAVTIITWIMLSTLDVKFSLTLAVITGVCAAIPIVGMITAAMLSTLVAIFDGTRFLQGLPAIFEGVAIFTMYVILNFIVDYVLSPFVLGKINTVNPFVLILAILFGTMAFGIAGTILAIPTILIVRTIIEHTDQPQ